MFSREAVGIALRISRHGGSLAWLITLTGLVCFVLAFLTHATQLTGDAWWAWVAGRWEVRHGMPLRMNLAPNGALLHHAAWVNLEWGWEGLLGAVAGTGTHPAVVPLAGLTFAAAGLAWGLTAWGAAQWTRRWDAGRLAIVGVALLPLWFLFFDTVRPQILTASAWIALLQCLLAARRDVRWLWAIVLLTALWAPLHGDWVLAPILCVTDAGYQAILHRAAGSVSRLGAAAASVLVGLALTPGHLAGLAYIVWLSGNPWIHRIAEWQPPVWHQPWFAAWLGLWILAAGLLAWRIRQGRPIPSRLALWWGATVFMTCLERRMMLYNAPITAWVLAATLPDTPWTITGGRRAVLTSAAAVAAAGIVGIAVGWQSDAGPWIPPLARTAAWVHRHPTPGYTLILGPCAAEWEAMGRVPRIYLDGRVDFFLRHAPGRIRWSDRLLTRGVAPASLAAHDVTRVIWWPGPLAPGLARTLRAAHWRVARRTPHWQVLDPPSAG